MKRGLHTSNQKQNIYDEIIIGYRMQKKLFTCTFGYNYCCFGCQFVCAGAEELIHEVNYFGKFYLVFLLLFFNLVKISVECFFLFFYYWFQNRNTSVGELKFSSLSSIFLSIATFCHYFCCLFIVFFWTDAFCSIWDYIEYHSSEYLLTISSTSFWYFGLFVVVSFNSVL